MAFFQFFNGCISSIAKVVMRLCNIITTDDLEKVIDSGSHLLLGQGLKL